MTSALECPTMRFLLPICLLCAPLLLSAQKAKESSVYVTENHKLYTYSVIGLQPSTGVSDDVPVINSGVIENITSQFNQIAGVTEVIYDHATNTFSITATKSAELPEEVHYKSLEIGTIKKE